VEVKKTMSGDDDCERRVLTSGAVAFVHKPFGDPLAFAEPAWYRGVPTPFYAATHAAVRNKVRAFVDAELTPHIEEWEEAGGVPRELFRKAYACGILGMGWPKEFGGQEPFEWDAFHSIVKADELARCGAAGVATALTGSLAIALPPILTVGSDYLKEKVARDCISGEKVIALAITEPWAGSDVAAIRTTAHCEGDVFVVNGLKKFITAGMYADYFTTAVRTGGDGMGGISLLLIEKSMPGVHCSRLKTTGWLSSATTLVRFENVRVPVRNLIGEENAGFMSIMLNFNGERLGIVCSALRSSRLCLSESAKYARQRTTFGKPLMSHQVIRAKLGDMARQVEALQALTDELAWQVATNADPRVLGPRIALAKVQSTRTMEFCARESAQIFGGNSYLRQGIGALVERIGREVRVLAVGGGSEEVMLDFAIRASKL
jgi:alkylation response protein AidB-like acyl-CoA dehydrogenase